MKVHNRINKFLQQRKQPANQSNDSKQPHRVKSQEESAAADVVPKQMQYYPPDKSIIHCPTSMVLFFILMVEALAITAMEGCIIYYHTLIFAHCDLSLRTLGLSQVDLVYHGIFIMSFVYQLFLYMDALRQRNVFQLMILLLYGILLVIFTGIQTIQHLMFEKAGCNIPPLVNAMGNTTTLSNNNDTTTTSNKLLHMSVVISNTTKNFQDNVDDNLSNVKPFEYAILVFVPICFLMMVGCVIKLYTLFRWDQYKSHALPPSANNDTRRRRLRTTLMAWAVLTGLLKLDFFFLFSYAAQLVPSQLMSYPIPPYESVIVFCFSFLAFLLAIQGTRNENIKLMWLFSLVLLGSIGYFGYRLFTFGIPRDTTNDPYMLTRYNLLFTTLTLTLLMIMTLCTCFVCIRNVSSHKVLINETFHCTCPTCYSVSFAIHEQHHPQQQYPEQQHPQQQQQNNLSIKQEESSSSH